MKSKLLITVLALTFVFCSKSSEDSGDTSDKDPSNETGTDEGGTDASPDEVAQDGTLQIDATLQELDISSALAGNTPAALLGSGSEVPVAENGTIQVSAPLRLQADGRKKSRDACQIRIGIKKALREMYLAAYDICYAEANTGTLATGKKYHLPAIGNTPSQQVFMDPSSSDKINIFICENEVLKHKITVTGSNAGKTKGFYTSLQTGESSTAEFSGTFDNGFSNVGIIRSKAKIIEKNGDISTWTDAEFEFKNEDVSTAAYATLTVDSSSGTRLVDLGAKKVGTNVGTGVLYYDENSEDAGIPAGAWQAWFDAAGLELASTATDLFAQDGSLALALENLPSLPDSSAEPSTFASEDWDCQGTEAPDLSSVENSAYEACDALLDFIQEEDCSSDDHSEALGQDLDISSYNPAP